MIRFRLHSLIGKWQVRNERLLSKAHLARETGISRQTITSHLKNATTRVDLDVLAAYCRFFECSIGDVLEYVPDDDQDSRGT